MFSLPWCRSDKYTWYKAFGYLWILLIIFTFWGWLFMKKWNIDDYLLLKLKGGIWGIWGSVCIFMIVAHCVGLVKWTAKEKRFKPQAPYIAWYFSLQEMKSDCSNNQKWAFLSQCLHSVLHSYFEVWSPLKAWKLHFFPFLFFFPFFSDSGSSKWLIPAIPYLQNQSFLYTLFPREMCKVTLCTLSVTTHRDLKNIT